MHPSLGTLYLSPTLSEMASFGGRLSLFRRVYKEWGLHFVWGHRAPPAPQKSTPARCSYIHANLHKRFASQTKTRNTNLAIQHSQNAPDAWDWQVEGAHPYANQATMRTTASTTRTTTSTTFIIFFALFTLLFIRMRISPKITRYKPKLHLAGQYTGAVG